MRLAPRLMVAFGLLSLFSTVGLGATVRAERRAAETDRFRGDVQRACENVQVEIARQAAADERLIRGACQGGELVDRVAVARERGDLGMIRVGFAALVPRERSAFDLDELVLAVDDGDIIGADPKELFGVSANELARTLFKPERGVTLRAGDEPALVTRCVKARVGLRGARRIKPVLDRLGTAYGVTVNRKRSASPPGALAFPTRAEEDPATFVSASCTYLDGNGGQLPLVVEKSTKELDANLRRIDRATLLAVLTSLGAALVLAMLLARGLGRPLATLAEEAGKVARDEAQPLRIRGRGEIADLVAAFNRMIADLAETRRRLAATARVAAWREVARQVAHEVKNPLAPIRAAVETLRRLRARQDPAFDDYFDEATRTVLDEVHRISNIVTEFTRFARLPTPRPLPVDVPDVVRHVALAHKAAANGIPLLVEVRGKPREVLADRDQIVQVLTNLVQNALDACREEMSLGGGGCAVTMVVEHDGDVVHVTVADTGPGVAPELAPRLFEPYATTKAHGTGLGLAIAQRIAMEHQGELAYVGPNGFKRAEGGEERPRGAVFRLTLPVAGPTS